MQFSPACRRRAGFRRKNAPGSAESGAFTFPAHPRRRRRRIRPLLQQRAALFSTTDRQGGRHPALPVRPTPRTRPSARRRRPRIAVSALLQDAARGRTGDNHAATHLPPLTRGWGRAPGRGARQCGPPCRMAGGEGPRGRPPRHCVAGGPRPIQMDRAGWTPPPSAEWRTGVREGVSPLPGNALKSPRCRGIGGALF